MSSLSLCAATSFQRIASPEFSSDFSHHDPSIARLNHGSFGAVPSPVIKAEQKFRSRWRANPDSFYFGQELEAELMNASNQVEKHFGASSSSVALVENATVATTAIARRWSSSEKKKYENGQENNNVVMCLDVAYKAVEFGLRHICGDENVHVANVVLFEKAMKLPHSGSNNHDLFVRPQLTDEAILKRLDDELQRIQPSYVMLDHISSQPAIRLPVKKMVDVCRSHSCNVKEIAVDGAHAIGMLDIDVGDINADFYFCNLHKWSFASGPVCALHINAKIDQENPGLELYKTPHPIPSWRIGEGIVAEARWAGTRDYAAEASVPAALEYLEKWRNIDGINAMTFNKIGYKKAVEELRDAWKLNDHHDPAVTEMDYFAEAMGMLRLPSTLQLGDCKPGQPSGGVRSLLREKYGVEAAIGNFGEAGPFIRLSHAIYTTNNDIKRLRNAIYELSFK